MKKIAVITLLLLFINYAKAQVYIGPTAGFGHSQVTGLGGKNKFNPLISAGATLLYQTRSHIAFGADIKFSKEGDKEIFNESAADGSPNALHIVKSNYIRVPLKFIYSLGNPNNFIVPKLYFGVNPGFLIHETSDIYYKSKSFDFGDIIGAGIGFKLSRIMMLNADAAYYYGLINNLNSNYNRNIQLNIGLLVSLKGR